MPTIDELRAAFPNASLDFLARNSRLCQQQGAAGGEKGDEGAVRPKLERRPKSPAVGKTKKKEGSSRRFLVRITSVRKRLLDEDNLCEKYVVDCCRYAGLLPGDGPGETKIEACQRQVEEGEEEHTLVEIFELNGQNGIVGSDGNTPA